MGRWNLNTGELEGVLAELGHNKAPKQTPTVDRQLLQAREAKEQAAFLADQAAQRVEGDRAKHLADNIERDKKLVEAGIAQNTQLAKEEAEYKKKELASYARAKDQKREDRDQTALEAKATTVPPKPPAPQVGK